MEKLTSGYNQPVINLLTLIFLILNVGEEELQSNGAVGISVSANGSTAAAAEGKTTDKAKSLETPRVDIGDSVSKCNCVVE